VNSVSRSTRQAQRARREAVGGQFERGVAVHVLGDRAQTFAKLERVGRGDDLPGTVELAQEPALERFDRAFVLEPGKPGAATVVGEGRRGRDHRQRRGDERPRLEERAAVCGGVGHLFSPQAVGKNLSTSNLPAWRAGAPTALMLKPFLPQ
jgi:hypothetical protein